MFGKEPEVKRFLDAQDRVFLPERRLAGKDFFDRAKSHPKETFVEVKLPEGKEDFLVSNVVEEFVTSEQTVKEILTSLTYYHDEMSTIRGAKEGAKQVLL